MRVFVAGASGALGTRLVRQLVERGHSVVGTYHSPGREAEVNALGATAVRLNLLDAPAVLTVVGQTQPDAIVHQATALAAASVGPRLDRAFEPTNRLRTAGTDALVAAARSVGVPRLVAQSFAPYRYERVGGPVKSEQDRLDPNPPASARQTFGAMRHLEEAVVGVGGIALRYGLFYGAADPTTQRSLLTPIRKRRYPVIGDGGGIVSFVQLDDAASATVLAVEHDGTGIFNIVDDEPAAMREWVPWIARVVGARPPLRIPAAIAGLFAGRDSVAMLTTCRGASNARARRELGWVPRHPSWRQGFVEAYGQRR
jgi:nucleoside-diphosphate-sugar epimerase